MATKFMKNDMLDGKIMPSLIDVNFKEDLSRLLTLGGYKYDFDNWRKATKSDISRYRDALERHLMQIDKGEIIDTDTGLPHSICVAFNAMALHYLHRKFNIDNKDRKDFEKRLKSYKEAKCKNLKKPM